MAKAKKAAPQRRQGGAKASADLLLEIGTEELPYECISPTLRMLAEGAERLLKEARLSHGAIRTLGTPRRLVLTVETLAAQQPPSVTEAFGPPKAAAYDAASQPTRAALGFAKSQGVAVEDLQIRQTPKGDYVCAVKRERGLPTHAVLQTVLPTLIGNLTFPKTMRWNETGVRFARPIRWLLALCGPRVIHIELGGVTAGNRTWGHRFAGGQRAGRRAGRPVTSLAGYYKELARQAVVPDPEERRELIVGQLRELAASVQGQLDYDEELLEQAIFSVECPRALVGTFDATFLNLPKDVLTTAMKEHQGFFPLTNSTGTLLPCFISVTNMALKNMALIRQGNERVLAARLADAKFFFEEDRKCTLADRVEKLKSVTFHQKLGTLHQKTGRVMALSARIADRLGDLDLLDTVRRAAQLSKADLLTGMVGEFPTLQGVMGGEYARLDGEPPEVSAALAEQYLPPAMEGDLPRSSAGQVLSLADRLDSLAAFFSVGIVPTGSEDPLGLRRHALAAVRILVEGNLRLDLKEILAQAREGVAAQGFHAGGRPQSTEKQRPADALEFVTDRLRYYGRTTSGLRDDVMDAVLATRAEGPVDLADLLARMRALQAMTGRPEFEPLLVGFRRAHRLTHKEQWDNRGIDPLQLQHPTEEELYRVVEAANANLPQCLGEGRYLEALDILVGMKPAVDAFFDGVLVNAEEPALRANRLSLLAAVAGLFASFADFSQIIVDGT